MGYAPLISWETIIKKVDLVEDEDNNYYINFSNHRNPNDYGIDTIGVDNYYIVVYTGFIFEVKEVVNSNKVKAYELTNEPKKLGTFVGKPAFIYQSKNGVPILTQAMRKRLHRSAFDIIWNIENNIIGSGSDFNWDRPIKSLPYIGQNLGSEYKTISEGLEAIYFAFIPATISINGNVTKEVGVTFDLTISGSVTHNDETVFSNGRIERSDTSEISFSGDTSYNETDSGLYGTSPGLIESYVAKIDVNNNGEPGTIQSSTKSVGCIYPYFYGLSPDPSLSGSSLYTTLNKILQGQGDKVHSFNASDGDYIYFVIPASWSDLSDIVDNGGDGDSVISSFMNELRTVSSSGISPGYSVNFKVYRTKNPMAPGEHTLDFRV